jgi:hypothetical protein
MAPRFKGVRLTPVSNYNIVDDRRGEACLARSLLSDTIGFLMTLFTDYLVFMSQLDFGHSCLSFLLKTPGYSACQDASTGFYLRHVSLSLCFFNIIVEYGC